MIEIEFITLIFIYIIGLVILLIIDNFYNTKISTKLVIFYFCLLLFLPYINDNQIAVGYIDGVTIPRYIETSKLSYKKTSKLQQQLFEEDGYWEITYDNGIVESVDEIYENKKQIDYLKNDVDNTIFFVDYKYISDLGIIQVVRYKNVLYLPLELYNNLDKNKTYDLKDWI